jgi:hypothetical protein
MIAAVSATDSWVASDNAEIRWEFVEAGPVEHDTKIWGFTATPNLSLDTRVDSKSGLQIELRLACK